MIDHLLQVAHQCHFLATKVFVLGVTRFGTNFLPVGCGVSVGGWLIRAIGGRLKAIAIVWFLIFARSLICPMCFLSAGGTKAIGVISGSSALYLLEKSIGVGKNSRIGAAAGEVAKDSRQGLRIASSTIGRQERVIIQGTILVGCSSINVFEGEMLSGHFLAPFFVKAVANLSGSSVELGLQCPQRKR